MRTEKYLYQWDINQKFIDVKGSYVDYIINDEVYRVEVVNRECIIPDELLQIAGSHTAYECFDDNTRTEVLFTVKDRPIPPDYVFTPTQRTTFDGLVQKVDDAVDDMYQKAESGEFDGRDGTDGEDGFSPVISVDQIEGGHRVTITDKTGTKSFDVLDGQGTSAGMSYYKVTCDMVHFYHDGVIQTYSDLVEKYNDDNYFLYAECNGLTFIPSLPPLEEDPILEFINTAIYGGVATITRLIINSSNEVKYNDVVVAEKSDVDSKVSDVQINGTSIVGSNKVANIPYASNNDFGVFKTGYNVGINASGLIFCYDRTYSQYVSNAVSSFVAKGTLENVLDNESVRFDKVQSMTEAQKEQARVNLGIVSAEGVMF